ncbi:efflux transporter outer membrane subunit [Luteibacter sahnii]|uniref:efflux transporter outer membrane subunit n=1 Tax=Luteibacter sahnii TaxID=3021977 RepID=UPI002A6A3245|nr:efflux transporter outer membrane subunit [Luteibacter sp. PPL193]MDY1549924.1 efflux transporter outer membrane subunit [Luteibacter sp. PPL193]
MRHVYREDAVLWPHSALLVVMLALVALLPGCSLAPTYERPVVTVPATLGEPRAATRSEASPPAAISADERRFLVAFAPGDEALHLVASALATHPDLRAAAAQLAEARAEVTAQRSGLFPQLDARAQRDKARLDDPRAAAILDRDFTSATLDFRFEPDVFGRVSRLSEAAAHDYMASAAAQAEARAALIADVLAAYVDERASAEVSERLGHAAEAADALAAQARTQEAVGTISADQAQEHVDQAARAHIASTDARRQHADALRRLRSLAGYDLPDPAANIAAIGVNGIPDGDLRSLPSDVLLQRPDVMRAEERLRAANARIGAARAAFFPSIQLSSSAGHVSTDLAHLFGAATGGWTFLPQVTLPLFDGGARQADLDLAKARKNAAVAAYESTVRDAFRDVADALGGRDAAILRTTRLAPVCRANGERLRKALARQQRGLEDASTLLARTIDAAQVQVDCLSAQRAQALNRIAVFRAFYGVTLPAADGVAHAPSD